LWIGANPGRKRTLPELFRTLTGVPCETQHVDQSFGTDAGAGFDAPARDVHAVDAGDAVAETAEVLRRHPRGSES
jgi:hypothetical protein